MKKILIGLALIACYSAEAQTTETASKPAQTSSKGKTYMVCREEGGYYNCCEHQRKTVKTVARKKKTVTTKTSNALVKTNTTPAAKPTDAVLVPAHRVAVKHRRTTPARPVAAATTTGTMTACRMVPFQVCKINADRRSVTCYPTTDADNLTPSGPSVTYGDTGPMPGEVVHFKVKPVVIKGEDKGAFCRRNKDNNATICTQPGLIVRDENGFYSYAEPASNKAVNVATTR